MLLGKVVGSVWGTQVTEGITARKLLIVEPVAGVYPTLESGHVIATDNLGAGTGDHVIVCFGSPSRNSYDEGENTPFEASILGIVDSASTIEDDPSLDPSIFKRVSA